MKDFLIQSKSLGIENREKAESEPLPLKKRTVIALSYDVENYPIRSAYPFKKAALCLDKSKIIKVYGMYKIYFKINFHLIFADYSQPAQFSFFYKLSFLKNKNHKKSIF